MFDESVKTERKIIRNIENHMGIKTRRNSPKFPLVFCGFVLKKNVISILPVFKSGQLIFYYWNDNRQ